MQGQFNESISLLDGKSAQQMRQEAVDALNNNLKLESDEERAEQLRRFGYGVKKKTDYRLYPLYLSVKKMEDECAITMNELIVKQEDGTWLQTETYKVFVSSSADNEELLKQMEVLWLPIAGQVDQLKASWIKEKVIQTRYSRRGHEYMTKLQDLVDSLFTLSTLCINFLQITHNLTKDVNDV